MRHRFRRLLSLFILGACVLSVAARGVEPAAAQPSAPAQSTRVETVHTAFDLLMDQFYRVPAPDALLAAAWDGAVDALRTAGYRGQPPPPPDLPADRAPAWQTFAASYPLLAALAPAGLSQKDIAFAAVAAMAESLNEGHTAFLSPEDYQAFLTGLSGDAEEVGLGVIISVRAPWLVTEVAPSSPAARGGILPGDVILAVDGQDVTALARRALNRMLRRAPGAGIELLVDRPGVGQVLLTVTVGTFVFPSFEARMLPGGTGYIRLRHFDTFIATPGGRPSVLQQLDAALESFEAAGATAWVVDLRDNPGGFGFTADALVGRFLPDAITTNVRNDRGNHGRHGTLGRPFRVQRPMAVIVNEGSASSSEIFAGAMQEYGRAALVGQRTAGVLAGALLFPLPDDAGLYIAVEEAHTGRNDAIVDGKGIDPDVTVPDTRTAADYAAGRDPQLDAAVAAARARPRPAAPAFPPAGTLSGEALSALAAPYLPSLEEAPSTPLIPRPRLLGELALTVPNEVGDLLGPVEDPAALAQTVHERGWQGSYSRYFGQAPGLSGPYLSVTIDLYTSQAGAYSALNANDAPQVQQSAPVPEQFGDGAVAYRGVWEAAGTAILAFRSGRAVVTITYAAVPGQVSFDPVVALARVVEARLRARPLPELEPVTA